MNPAVSQIIKGARLPDSVVINEYAPAPTDDEPAIGADPNVILKWASGTRRMIQVFRVESSATRHDGRVEYLSIQIDEIRP